MTQLVAAETYVPASSSTALQFIAAVIEKMQELPAESQVDIETLHTIHGGVYTRTIMVPANVLLAGVMITVPTTLVICGDVSFSNGDIEDRIAGYKVYTCSAGRQQVLFTHADTWFTMIMRTEATTVEDAENEFTDDPDALGSRRSSKNTTIITGE